MKWSQSDEMRSPVNSDKITDQWWSYMCLNEGSPLWTELKERGWHYASGNGAIDDATCLLQIGVRAIDEAAKRYVDKECSLSEAVDWLESQKEDSYLVTMQKRIRPARRKELQCS